MTITTLRNSVALNTYPTLQRTTQFFRMFCYGRPSDPTIVQRRDVLMGCKQGVVLKSLRFEMPHVQRTTQYSSFVVYQYLLQDFFLLFRSFAVKKIKI